MGARPEDDELATRLGAYLARRMGVAWVTVAELVRLPGGASRESWAFVATAEGRAPVKLVLRRDPVGPAVNGSRRDEFELLRLAAEAGVPVPRVHWCEEEAGELGAPCFVMDFVDGETLARRLLRDDVYAGARAALPEQLATMLARIHRIDVGAVPFLARPGAGETPGAAELGRWEQVYRAITPDPHPALELAFRWLAARVPAPARLAVVHGDFRIGNVIFGADGLRAVLDWELAHVGDPVEDIGWLCVRSWRFGGTLPVGGLAAREAFVAAYEAAGGAPVDLQAVRWWEVLGNLKWAIVCIMQARTFLDGRSRSVELASLGRRVAEMELELLDLTEG